MTFTSVLFTPPSRGRHLAAVGDTGMRVSAGRVVMLGTDEATGAECRPLLEAAGFRVVVTRQEEIDLHRVITADPELLVLDLASHRGEGLELCLRLNHSLPIIMLGDRSDEGERILALEIGADDFVTRPLSPRELVARVRAVLRRWRGAEPPKNDTPPLTMERAWFRIDFGTREVSVAGRTVWLARRKFDLLRFFLTHPHVVHRRSELLDQVWGSSMDHAVGERTVDAHVRSLRRVLEVDTQNPTFIVTVRGVGYRCDPDALDENPPPRSR